MVNILKETIFVAIFLFSGEKMLVFHIWRRILHTNNIWFTIRLMVKFTSWLTNHNSSILSDIFDYHNHIKCSIRLILFLHWITSHIIENIKQQIWFQLHELFEKHVSDLVTMFCLFLVSSCHFCKFAFKSNDSASNRNPV